MQGSSEGPKYGQTSHFWPYGHSGSKLDGGKELFPTKDQKRGVVVSSIGVAAVLAGLAAWASRVGIARVTNALQP